MRARRPGPAARPPRSARCAPGRRCADRDSRPRRRPRRRAAALVRRSCVDEDAVVRRVSPAACASAGTRDDADAHHDEIGGETRAVVELDLAARRSPSACCPRWKRTPCASCRLPDERADLVAQDAGERDRLRPDDVHLEPALPQRRGRLEADEAGADHDDALSGCRARDDRPAVGQRPQQRAREAASRPGIASRRGSAPVARTRAP